MPSGPMPHVAEWLARFGSPEVSPAGRLALLTIVVQEDDLSAVFSVMTALSEHWLRQHPGAPRLADVATYERERKGENDWLALPVSLNLYPADYPDPVVDCEDASIADAAEARVYEGLPRALPITVFISPRMRHIVTDLGNGARRDKSLSLVAKATARMAR